MGQTIAEKILAANKDQFAGDLWLMCDGPLHQTRRQLIAFGARGGLYIMGGIVPRIYEFFRHSAFRERFEFRGRYRAYLAAIPTYVVMHRTPAFIGLKTLFASP